MRSKTILRIIGAFCLAMLLFVEVWAEDSSNSGHWVSAWSTAVHAPLPFPGLPPSPVFENQTIRMIVRPTIGGERLRIRFSNVFGTTSLKIGSAHVALSSKASAIVPESDHALTFGGKASVTVPPGAPILSDPIELKVLPLSEVAVSVYLPEKTASSSVHFWAQHETYISEPGDLTARQDIPNPTTKSSWYWLADVEVWATNQTSATVISAIRLRMALGRNKASIRTGRIYWQIASPLGKTRRLWPLSTKESVVTESCTMAPE